jgi:hypothetical protein
MSKLTLWDSNQGSRPANFAVINNLVATGTPVVGNDSTQGYEPGSIWLYGSAVYICTSSAVGAAAWEQIASEANFVVGATDQKAVAAPVAPSSTSAYFMQGLAGSITPVRSGKVLLTISGTVIASTVTAGDGIEHQLSYGTGAAPANAAALAGTQVGTVQSYTNPAIVTAADVAVPFSTSAVITGLTLNTAYWLDLAAKSLATASSGGLSNVSVSAVEL